MRSVCDRSTTLVQTEISTLFNFNSIYVHYMFPKRSILYWLWWLMSSSVLFHLTNSPKLKDIHSDMREKSSKSSHWRTIIDSKYGCRLSFLTSTPSLWAFSPKHCCENTAMDADSYAVSQFMYLKQSIISKDSVLWVPGWSLAKKKL